MTGEKFPSGEEEPSRDEARIPAEVNLDYEIEDILTMASVYFPVTETHDPEAEVSAKGNLTGLRVEHGQSLESTIGYHERWRSISITNVLKNPDGTAWDIVGFKTDKDGVYDRTEDDAAYRISFHRMAGPPDERRIEEAFSVEKYKDKEGTSTLIVWDRSQDGSAEYFSGEEIEKRPHELDIVKKCQDRLNYEVDGLLGMVLDPPPTS